MNSVIYFLDVLLIRKWPMLATKLGWQPTYTGHYLSYQSNYPPHLKKRSYSELT